MMEYRQRIRVRYGECDIQGIVFNANYLVYVDDVVEQWLESGLDGVAFDYMVKKVLVEWDAPARRSDLIDLTATVTRWGRTSFDITVRGEVAGRSIFTAVLTGISVTPGTHKPTPVPEEVRAKLA
jgi:acyl-CoA thioester hydrolase